MPYQISSSFWFFSIPKFIPMPQVVHVAQACQGLGSHSGVTLFTLPRNGAEGLQSAPTDLLRNVSYRLSLLHSLVVPNGPNGLEVVSDDLQITLSVKFGG